MGAYYNKISMICPSNHHSPSTTDPGVVIWRLYVENAHPRPDVYHEVGVGVAEIIW